MAVSSSQNVFLSLLGSRRCLIAGRIVGFMPRRGSVARIGLPMGVLLIAACDPVVNVAGANFPAWLLCAIAGATLSAIFRPVFAATGIERYLGPRLLIYPSLAILLACLIYLIFFNRI
jgi:YtcA family